ncbi:MAG: hypothetical protein ABSA42_15675 [Terracidiphilus sp.]
MMDSLIEELEGVQGLLPSSYYSVGDADEDGDDDTAEAGKIESEEVEVALAAAVSSIGERCDLPIDPESLSQLLEMLFSSDDDLVSIAVNLEDAINGYFGELFGENLDLADTYFSDLIAILKERREKWKMPPKG